MKKPLLKSHLLTHSHILTAQDYQLKIIKKIMKIMKIIFIYFYAILFILHVSIHANQHVKIKTKTNFIRTKREQIQ